MAKITAARALKNLKANSRGSWSHSNDSSARSDDPEDACNRIHEGYARIGLRYPGPRFPASTPVVTMGSCFAREIEAALIRRGGIITSMDDSIKRPEFRDRDGKFQPGFFHRYTPTAMLQEFRWPFGMQKGWSEDALIYEDGLNQVVDLNYSNRAALRTRKAAAVRRKVSGALVRKVAEARIVIVTLGLTESWGQHPSGLAVNSPVMEIIRRQPEEFRLHLLDYEQVTACLNGIHELLTRTHKDGDFQLFLTISPVPLRATFTDEDVVIANQTSKSTMRAAAIQLAAAHENVHYFPSYEMVLYSGNKFAWRPDRIHVRYAMTTQIMDEFIRTVFEEGALPAV